MVIILQQIKKRQSKSQYSMGAADSNKGLDRPYYQGMVVATAAFSGFSNAQAPGMAGYVIPQITNGKDSIYVDRGTASWVGEQKIRVI